MFEKFEMARGAKILLEDCYQVKLGMEVLIVTDTSPMLQYGEIFARAVHEAGAEAVLAIMSPRRCDGEEPPRSIASAMKGPNGPDLVVTVARHVLHHSNAVQEAQSLGTLFVTPISEGRVERLGEFNTPIGDLKKIAERNVKLVEFFKDKDQVHVTSATGTDLTLSVKGRSWFHANYFMHTTLWRKEGLSDFKDDDLFPDMLGYSEATCSPVPGSANGIYVVDTTMCGIGLVDKPIIWKIKNGNIVEISGGKTAEQLKNFLKYKTESAINIGEFGLGTNHIIKDPRGDHMDKAILGGMHLGMGSSASVMLKGDVQAEIHEDGISLGVTVTVDGETIIESGRLLI